MFVLLTAYQKKELTRFVLENETSFVDPADTQYQTIFRGKYTIPQQAKHPFMEIHKDDSYFC